MNRVSRKKLRGTVCAEASGSSAEAIGPYDVCVCVHRHIYIYTYTYTHIHKYTCVYIYIYI